MTVQGQRVQRQRVRRPRGWTHPDLDDVGLGVALDALGDPVRLEVVRQLADSGGAVQGAFDVRVTDQTLSHHLKVLTDAGVVRVSQVGRFRRCELRLAEWERRFPGLPPAILANAGSSPGVIRAGGVAGQPPRGAGETGTSDRPLR